MKTILAFLLIVVVLGGLGWFFFMRDTATAPVVTQPVATTTPESTEGKVAYSRTTVIGESEDGSNITAHQYGTGETEVLFVGGIHGGYSWNTSLLAYELIDYLEATPEAVPENVQVTVIPVANPDGLEKVTGETARFSAADVSATVNTAIGRFNANNVDLNRNFDCDWKASAIWQNKSVSGGSAAFSESESQALRTYVETAKPHAVVVWYASAGGVYSSNCHGGVLAETETLTNIYAEASGYPAYKVFDYYATTGDFTNWLAKIGTPAISVLLTNHTNTEWAKNRAGIEAVISHYDR